MPDKFDPSNVPAFNTPGLTDAASAILSALSTYRASEHASAAESVASDFGYILAKLRAFGA